MRNSEMVKLSIQKSYRNLWKNQRKFLIDWIMENGIMPNHPVYQAMVRSYVELCEKVDEPKVILVDGHLIDFEFDHSHSFLQD